MQLIWIPAFHHIYDPVIIYAVKISTENPIALLKVSLLLQQEMFYHMFKIPHQQLSVNNIPYQQLSVNSCFIITVQINSGVVTHHCRLQCVALVTQVEVAPGSAIRL
jgi:hypothetical protein